MISAMALLGFFAGVYAVPRVDGVWLRIALVIGIAVFLVIGLAGLAAGSVFLTYPRNRDDTLDRRDPGDAGGGTAGRVFPTMSVAAIFGISASLLVGIGLYGLIVQPHPLRKMLSFNVLGGGTFLLFGAIARRGAAAGFGGDPVPQALVITGMVVAFSATALGVAILLRFFKETGQASLRDPMQSTPTESDR